MADAFKSVLVRQITKNWESLQTCHASWNILRDQGFILLQSLVNDHLQSIFDHNLNDIEKVLNKLKLLTQRMQTIHLIFLQIKADASDRIRQEITNFICDDLTIDQWSKN